MNAALEVLLTHVRARIARDEARIAQLHESIRLARQEIRDLEKSTWPAHWDRSATAAENTTRDATRDAIATATRGGGE